MSDATNEESLQVTSLRAFLINSFETKHNWILFWQGLRISTSTEKKPSALDLMLLAFCKASKLDDRDEAILSLSDVSIEHRLAWIDVVIKALRNNGESYLIDESIANMQPGYDFTENRAIHMFGWTRPESFKKYTVIKQSPGQLTALMNISPSSITRVEAADETEEEQVHIEFTSVIRWSQWKGNFHPYLAEMYSIFQRS